MKYLKTFLESNDNSESEFDEMIILSLVDLIDNGFECYYDDGRIMIENDRDFNISEVIEPIGKLCDLLLDDPKVILNFEVELDGDFYIGDIFEEKWLTDSGMYLNANKLDIHYIEIFIDIRKLRN